MNKLLVLVLTLALGVASVSAIACPKGETLTGGTGKHHKGGKCVGKAEVKELARAKDAKEDVKAAATAKDAKEDVKAAATAKEVKKEDAKELAKAKKEDAKAAAKATKEATPAPAAKQ